VWQVVGGHICWQPKALHAVWQLFASRFELHQQVYQHPGTKGVEALVADALVAADSLLNLRERCNK
jgi:HD superfamily phosphohydrolase